MTNKNVGAGVNTLAGKNLDPLRCDFPDAVDGLSDTSAILVSYLLLRIDPSFSSSVPLLFAAC